jgi:hypothetical protein
MVAAIRMTASNSPSVSVVAGRIRPHYRRVIGGPPPQRVGRNVTR